MLERLRFLRRVTKYPVVYQVTKATTRLLGQDSSIRRRHTLETVQGRLLGVHFYLEANDWPATFALDHEEKITFLNLLVVPHVQLDDVSVDLRGDSHEIGAYRGIIGLRSPSPLEERHDDGYGCGSDNPRTEQPAKDGAYSRVRWNVFVTHGVNL